MEERHDDLGFEQGLTWCCFRMFMISFSTRTTVVHPFMHHLATLVIPKQFNSRRANSTSPEEPQ